jgi:hypothetical protein
MRGVQNWHKGKKVASKLQKGYLLPSVSQQPGILQIGQPKRGSVRLLTAAHRKQSSGTAKRLQFCFLHWQSFFSALP